MRDDSETHEAAPVPERRRRGRRPADARARRQSVEKALAELTAAHVPFSMGDLAERAGISRATLYRDAGLRDLVGSAGEGPAQRPVMMREHTDLQQKAQTLAAERRVLRRQLKELEQVLERANARADELEQENRRLSREQVQAEARGATGAAGEKARAEAYAEGFAAGTRAAQQRGGGAGRGSGAASGDLLMVAQRLPKASLLNARKTLARALHPDLYATDPAAALLATELLKQINALVAPPPSR